jgi:hypothetical protein
VNGHRTRRNFQRENKTKAGTARAALSSRSQFLHLAMRRGRKIAKVAMARKLAVTFGLLIFPSLLGWL